MRTLTHTHTHTHTHVLSLTLPSLPSGIHRSSLDGKRYMSSSKLCCVCVVKSASMISDACHNICMLCAYRCSQSEHRALPQILFGWVVFFDTVFMCGLHTACFLMTLGMPACFDAILWIEPLYIYLYIYLMHYIWIIWWPSLVIGHTPTVWHSQTENDRQANAWKKVFKVRIGLTLI